MNKNIPEYYNISQEDFTKLKTLEMLEIVCQQCFSPFKTKKKNILEGMKNRGAFVKFCSAKCSSADKSIKNRQEVACTNCDKTLYRIKSEIEKSTNHFCTKSCAASYNNKIYIKRKLTKKCVECSEVVFSHRSNRCEKHHKEHINNRYCNKTIGEYRNKLSVKGKHPSWVNSHIRLFAKSWNKELLTLPCAKCSYNKHVELAHIKAISTYSDDTVLSEVNNKLNLIQLCPNCHWEFDNGFREEFKPLLESLGKIYS